MRRRTDQEAEKFLKQAVVDEMKRRFPEGASSSWKGFSGETRGIRKFGERGILAKITTPSGETDTIEILEAELK